MEQEIPRVGGDIDAYCTKCRMDLTHTIHALDTDGIPARVECNTCHGVHRYRAPKSARSAPKARASTSQSASARMSRAEKAANTRAAAAAAKLEESWEALLSGKEGDARPYRFAESYNPGDILRHTQFGLGVVESRINPQKISVLFREGRKVLIDNRVV